MYIIGESKRNKMDKIFEILRPSFEGVWEYFVSTILKYISKEELIFLSLFIGFLIFFYLFTVLMTNFFVKIGKWWRDFKEWRIFESHKNT